MIDEQAYRQEWMTDRQWYCTEMLAAVAGGHHHLGKVVRWGDGVRVVWRAHHRLSTFDSVQLTALVVAAHDAAVRISIEPAMRYLAVTAHYRGTRTGDMFERHPTIEDAIAACRQWYAGPVLDPAEEVPA